MQASAVQQRQQVGTDRFYATRLRQLAHLDVSEQEAGELWRNVAQHRRALLNRLGRDVGQRVALLDYIVNMQPQAGEPHIIDKQALDAIEHQAATDSLTGLQNRHHFQMEMERLAERSRRYGTSSSLLLLDLDAFKSVNDEHGHRVGDEVLQAVSALLLRLVRVGDVPCRIGGDEFAIILPDTPEGEALRMSQRICADINTWFARNEVAGNRLGVRVSGGIASLPLELSSETDVSSASESATNLMESADIALYQAKRSGGAQVLARTGRTRATDVLDGGLLESN